MAAAAREKRRQHRGERCSCEAMNRSGHGPTLANRGRGRNPLVVRMESPRTIVRALCGRFLDADRRLATLWRWSRHRPRGSLDGGFARRSGSPRQSDREAAWACTRSAPVACGPRVCTERGARQVPCCEVERQARQSGADSRRLPRSGDFGALARISRVLGARRSRVSSTAGSNDSRHASSPALPRPLRAAHVHARSSRRSAGPRARHPAGRHSSGRRASVPSARRHRGGDPSPAPCGAYQPAQSPPIPRLDAWKRALSCSPPCGRGQRIFTRGPLGNDG